MTRRLESGARQGEAHCAKAKTGNPRTQNHTLRLGTSGFVAQEPGKNQLFPGEIQLLGFTQLVKRTHTALLEVTCLRSMTWFLLHFIAMLLRSTSWSPAEPPTRPVTDQVNDGPAPRPVRWGGSSDRGRGLRHQRGSRTPGRSSPPKKVPEVTAEERVLVQLTSPLLAGGIQLSFR